MIMITMKQGCAAELVRIWMHLCSTDRLDKLVTHTCVEMSLAARRIQELMHICGCLSTSQ